LRRPKIDLFAIYFVESDVHCTLYKRKKSHVQEFIKHCSSIVQAVQALFKHCSSIVQALFKHCSSIVQEFFKHCSSIVQALFKHCSSTVQALKFFFVGSNNAIVNDRLQHCCFGGKANVKIQKMPLENLHYL
jgi:phage-related protein